VIAPDKSFARRNAIVGGGVQMPLMVEVRPRETKHGGESVKVIED